MNLPLSLSIRTVLPDATNVLHLYPDYKLWDFMNPDPMTTETLQDQKISGFRTDTPEADFTKLGSGDNLLSPKVSCSVQYISLISLDT